MLLENNTNQPINILITSSGRRSYIIEYFKKAVQPYNGKIHAMNSNLNSAAIWLADYQVCSPLIYSEDYESFIFNYCVENRISIIISLFDIELPVLSRLKSKFEEFNIRVLVGDEWLTKLANDKWETYQFLKRNGFKTKDCFLTINDFISNSTVDFPVVVKPRWGMASLSVFYAENLNELNFYFELALKQIKNSYLKFESELDWDKSVIIQEKFNGDEFGLDIINDLDGNYCNTIVKKKLAMRAGETDVAITVDIPELKILGEEISKLTKHPANMDLDVFFDGKESHILEMNPRFGGNYPFSHEAGVDLPKAIVNWHLGKRVPPEMLIEKIGFKSMKGIQMVNTIH